MNEMDLIEKRISSTVIAKIGPFEYCLDKVLLPNGEEKEKSLVPDEDRQRFITLVRTLFAQRRKTIRNNLLSSPAFSNLGKGRIESAFSALGLTGSERAETLSFDTLVALMRALG